MPGELTCLGSRSIGDASALGQVGMRVEVEHNCFSGDDMTFLCLQSGMAEMNSHHAAYGAGHMRVRRHDSSYVTQTL